MVVRSEPRTNRWADRLSPDTLTLSRVTVQSEIFLYDAKSGKELFVFTAPPFPADSQVNPQLIFSSDGQILVSVAPTTCWWNTQTGGQIATSNLKMFRCTSAALSSDGMTLFIGGDGPVGEFVAVHRVNSNLSNKFALVHERMLNIGSIMVVSCSPDGQWFVASNSEGHDRLGESKWRAVREQRSLMRVSLFPHSPFPTMAAVWRREPATD